ncbi:heme oxygenase (biliverdin-producing) [Nocardia seriolae]|uniref:biliverdin-producing heme oxygenase n=1 Tax=Nocardia seriolae TaxID=37332 RepID=UPI0007C6387D|nr:biliverdin-producing heme oxygenase [Nocardia seriolae]MTJ66630.1 biliverdin-producing heme oxygenase [Nocardia seriolae]MTJ71958.1 biliverdin-producing heme oxygenase [Nocardia seriolae]MTJ84759.1 biliverdin-producing heme oxygenase [Nocardia seriolae]MTK28747.1 biliverdin-producing heme oxygenase [Nocardia seriolae]MTK38333.1 biliverdin-producing heme oxygenase [Nocardia seriolae]
MLDTGTPFSTLIRTATEQQHNEAEHSTFMRDMLTGQLGVEAFYRYTAQLWFVYAALEKHSDALASDPVAGPFVKPELARRAALESDLAYLGGENWREQLTALPSTAAYAARIEECADAWSAGYVVHHYTRYLGDLSGGQVIRGTAEKQWNLPKKGDGVRFYVFDGIANPAAFKREYRESLDRLPLEGPEVDRVLDEARLAFTMNTDLFRELGAEFSARN